MEIRKHPKTFTIIVLAIIVTLLAVVCLSLRRMILDLRTSGYSTTHVMTVPIPPERGEIYDYMGNIISANGTIYDLHMDCCVVEDTTVWEEKSRMLAQEIAQILPERTAPLWWDYFQSARKDRRRYIPIVRNADQALIDTLSKLPLFNEGQFIGGSIVSAKHVRVHPHGNLARRTIGVWSSVSPDPLFGLEAQFDAHLTGEEGSGEIKTGYYCGKKIQRKAVLKDKIDGWDIHTTLDMRKQAVADSILRKAISSDDDIIGGCLALMEVKTGAVVTLANIHTFEDGTVGEYYDYMLNHSYEPGEVAQAMTLAAALSDGLIRSLEDRIPTNHGKLTDTSAISDDHIIRYERQTRSDSISVIDGFSISSTYIASNLAARYAESPDYYRQWLRTFCIGKDNFDIRMKDLTHDNTAEWDTDRLISIGTGYGFTVCPMQILTFYNTIANDGKLMKPMLVKCMESDGYGKKYLWPKELNKSAIRKEVADSLKKALGSCFESGYMSVKITGKIGTARQIMDPDSRKGSEDPYQDIDGKRLYASTFAGFYPADEPRYSVICVLFTKPTHKSLHGCQLPVETVRGFVEGTEYRRKPPVNCVL